MDWTVVGATELREISKYGKNLGRNIFKILSYDNWYHLCLLLCKSRKQKHVTLFLVIIILYIGIEMCKKIIHFHRFLIRSLQMKSFVYFCAYPKIIADKPKLAPKRLLQNALEFCKINYFPLYLESSEGRKTRGFFTQ